MACMAQGPYKSSQTSSLQQIAILKVANGHLTEGTATEEGREGRQQLQQETLPQQIQHLHSGKESRQIIY